jgi:CheY-like chemotaxis protein
MVGAFAPLKGESMPTNPIEILLVEDNPNDLELAVEALNSHRLVNRIQIVRDGAEALDFIFCNGPHANRRIEDAPKVVLLDLKLPKVTGLEVLKKLKADPRTRRIPVVVLTSSREERDLAASYELGANSYIVKPVDFQQFSDAMRTLGLYWILLNQYPDSLS